MTTLIRVLLLIASAVVLLFPPTFGRVLNVPGSFATIQDAIAAANNGDTVLVAPGTYRENVSYRGKNITVASRFLLNPDPSIIQQTIIDGSSPANADTGSVVRFITRVDSTATLCGFTLINGIGTLVPGSFAGGGILVLNASAPRIRYNIIRGNTAIQGAGIAVRNSAPLIENNAIVDNTAGDGGGIFLDGTAVTINHNVIVNNDAAFNGGALYIKNSFVDFTNNIVSGNAAPTCGGLHCNGGVWTIEHNNFYLNQAANFFNCGGAELGNFAGAKNFNLDSADIYGNIAKNPQYVNAIGFDYRLLCSSRLIDAGAATPGTYPQGGAREDIGMFEYPYRVGDLTGDNKINLADATVLINTIFLGTPVGCPTFMGDCDCNRRINITDIVALVNYWAGFAETACLYSPIAP